jgi:hypothetical protein
VKPIELLKLWSDLQAVLPLLTDEQKLVALEETRKSIPPAMVCFSAKVHAIVCSLIEKELEKYGRTDDKPKDRPKELKAPVRARKRKG